MKRLLLILTVFLVSIILYTVEARCDDWPYPFIEAEVEEITFYIGGAYSSIEIYGISQPEYDYNSNENAAYVRNSSNRKIDVEFWQDHGDSISSMEIYGYLPIQPGHLSDETISFPSGYGDGQFTFSNTMPNVVKEHYIVINWTAEKINGVALGKPIHFDSTPHYLYILYNQPQDPIDAPLDPHKDVLEYACNWASGKSTKAGIVADITDGVYNDLGKVWTGRTHTSDYGLIFNLTYFLDADIYEGVDCQDMAAAVQVFANTLGIPADSSGTDNVGQICIESDYRIYTKEVKLVGLDWGYDWFTFHTVAHFPRREFEGNPNVWTVYDACLKLYDTDEECPTGQRVPKGELVNSTYKDDFYYYGGYYPVRYRVETVNY